MKTESSINPMKESFNKSKKSDQSSPKKKYGNTVQNGFEKKLLLSKIKHANSSNLMQMSLTDELFRARAKSFTTKDKLRIPDVPVNLLRELQDPDNQKIKPEIERMIGVSSDITVLEDNYEEMKK